MHPPGASLTAAHLPSAEEWYRHDLMQWVVHHRLGVVALPFAHFDPAGECGGAAAAAAPGVYAVAGGRADWVEKAAAAAHGAPAPLAPPASLGRMPLGVFPPPGPERRFMLRPVNGARCASFERQGGRPVRNQVAVELMCAKLKEWRDARGVFAFYPDVGALRSMYATVSEVQCFAAVPDSAELLVPCSDSDRRQRWALEADGDTHVLANRAQSPHLCLTLLCALHRELLAAAAPTSHRRRTPQPAGRL